MENYVLYHEIYKKDGMIMYKGRKKGTITYVAVSCIEKDQRIKVTNHVRIVYDLIDKHVVRFYEWYETSNHLWLVTDLCVGGSLQQMLVEDKCFPESSIKLFGAHLIRGLQYLHDRQIVCVQWHPSKIVLDGGGTLKYFDFSDSKKINEDYDELVQRFFSGLNIEPREIEELFDYRRPTPYTAPEVLQGASPDFLSDIWGLGCVLFEMYAGQTPFGGTDENILNSPLIIPKMQGSRLSGRASTDLTNLLERMLHKNRDSRIALSALWRHPFWQGALDDLAHPKPAFTSSCGDSQDKSVRPKTATQPGSMSDDGDNSVTMNTADDASFVLHLGSRASEAGAGQQGVAGNQQGVTGTQQGVTDTLQDAGTDTRSKQRAQFQLEPANASIADVPNVPPDQLQLLEIATNSCADASRGKTQIEDYARMLKDGKLKFDAKLLAIPPFSMVKLRGMRKAERDKHMKQVENAVKTGEKGPPSQRRLHLINYLAQIAMSPEVSNFMVDANVAIELCRQLKTTSSQELMVRICQAVAIVVHHSSSAVAPQGADSCGEMLTNLGDLLRDQFRCSRVKIACLTALGESLVKMAELASGSSEDACEPPAFGMFVTLINRCLHRTEEVATNLVAARTIEIIAGHPSSPLAKQLTNIETMQQLYNSYKHATVDSLKVSAIVAMSRLTRIDSMQFCGLLDRVGSAGLLENMHVALLGVQEAVLEMFAVSMLVQPGVASVRKLGQEAAFLKSIMRLLETPSPLVRAKALLLVLLLCRSDISLLKAAADHRLVLYLERELKRTNGINQQQGNHLDVMEQCLGFFTSFLANAAVPTILDDCNAALNNVQGRKHPSSLQTKALRASLPMLECVTSLASSHSLRSHIFSESFCVLLGQLLAHAGRVDNGHTNLGSDISPQFLTHVLALVEAVCHCVDITGVILMNQLLEPLAVLTGSTGNADIRIIGLKLCGDIITTIVLSDMLDSNVVNMALLSNAIEINLLPQMQQFIVDPEPSAVYLLRLMRNYLQINADHCIASMRQHAFPQLLVKLLVDHQQRITSAVVLESLLLISVIGQISPDMLGDCIVDVDLVAHLCDTLFEIGDVYHKDDMSLRTPKTSELLQAALEGLYSLAKLISDLVKKAMKSKKSQENDEITARLTSEAEELLIKGKPLTEMVDLLIYSFSNSESDVEVVESSIKLLHQVVSLYGGQQIHHGLNEINMQMLCNFIATSSGQHVRTLLRILKRLLASGQLPSPSISVIVRDTVSNVVSKIDVQSDAICLGIVNEIKKYLVDM